MDRTACTEPQCLYKGALYLTSVPVQGAIYLFITTKCICRFHIVLMMKSDYLPDDIYWSIFVL